MSRQASVIEGRAGAIDRGGETEVSRRASVIEGWMGAIDRRGETEVSRRASVIEGWMGAIEGDVGVVTRAGGGADRGTIH